MEEEPEEITLPIRKQGRHLDSFLQELKREQVGNTAVSGRNARTSRDREPTNEPATSTNLFVGGLPNTITEHRLATLFAERGPVATVKILWPRSQQENTPHAEGSASLNGFVAYMKQRDAKKAMEHFDGFMLEGHKLRLDWAKPIPLPQRSMVDLQLAEGSRAAKRPRHSGRSSRGIRTPSPETTHVIHAMVDQVRQYGPQFEETIKKKQGANPRFRFLVAQHTNEYRYYHSCLSPASGRTSPAPSSGFSSHGSQTSSEADGDDEDLCTTDSEEVSEQEKTERGALGNLAQRRFVQLLRSLTTKRSSIARAMAFAVERTEQLDPIIDIITSSLIRTTTPIERKLARLYLVSDIINTSWRSHAKFKTLLPSIFQHLNSIYRSFPSRLKAEQFRARIEPVLQAFEHQIVFDADFVKSLTKTLVAAEMEEEALPGLSVTMPLAKPSEDLEDIDGEPMSESEL